MTFGPGCPTCDRSRHFIIVPRLQSRIFWLLVLILHALAAAGWWWLMPHGFPLRHSPFWVNELLPPIVIAIVIVAIVAAVAIGWGVEESLTVTDDANGRAATIDAVSILRQPSYSHLNTFCEFQFAGHRELSVAFSPCAEPRIGVQHFDYPVGDPARFAYLDAAGRFQVVEASSGEKGPFRELAQGPLSRGEPLALTLFDGDEPIMRITLLDFSAQASTALSPTAGWRVPVNAIEFSRDSTDPRSAASFFVTLAGSSVGRGFDSVGHGAGGYRNRMRVAFIEP